MNNIWILLQSASFKLLSIEADWRKVTKYEEENNIRTGGAAVGVLDVFLSETFHFPLEF